MRISKPCGQNQRNAEPDADLGTVRTKPNPKNVVRNRCADKKLRIPTLTDRATLWPRFASRTCRISM